MVLEPSRVTRGDREQVIRTDSYLGGQSCFNASSITSSVSIFLLLQVYTSLSNTPGRTQIMSTPYASREPTDFDNACGGVRWKEPRILVLKPDRRMKYSIKDKLKSVVSTEAINDCHIIPALNCDYEVLQPVEKYVRSKEDYPREIWRFCGIVDPDHEGAADCFKFQYSKPGLLFALLERDHFCNSRYECEHRKKIAKTQDQASETSIMRNAILPGYVEGL